MADFHYFKGKCKWAKLIVPDTKFEPTGVWSIDLYPIPESLDAIKKLKEVSNGVAGILNHIKKDEEGEYTSFKRKCQKQMRGVMKAYPPPEIMDAAGLPTPNVRIGNGSDVTVKVEVYQYTVQATKSKGRATRLWAVRVDNLVPFDESNYTEEQRKLVDGLAGQPEHLF